MRRLCSIAALIVLLCVALSPRIARSQSLTASQTTFQPVAPEDTSTLIGIFIRWNKQGPFDTLIQVRFNDLSFTVDTGLEQLPHQFSKFGDSVVFGIRFRPKHSFLLGNPKSLTSRLYLQHRNDSGVTILDSIVFTGLLKPTAQAAAHVIQLYPSFIGLSQDTTVTIFNNLKRSITLHPEMSPLAMDSQADSNTYGFSDTVISAKDSVRLKIHFTQRSSRLVYHVMRLHVLGNDSDLTYVDSVVFRSQPTTPTVDSAQINLTTQAPQTIAFRTASTDSRTVFLTNAGITPLIVSSVTLQKGDAFSFINMPELPFFLAPGAKRAITIRFAGDSIGFHQDAMIVSTDHIPAEDRIELQGEQTALVSVTRPRIQFSHFALAPNPSTGFVKIELEANTRAKIEIFDLLGRSIVMHHGTGSWFWNGLTSNGSPIAPGNYLVKVTGLDYLGREISGVENLRIVR